MSERIRRIKALIAHRKAFRLYSNLLLGKRTIIAYTHDLDKLLMLMFLWFIPVNTIRRWHKERARHHNPITWTDYLEKAIDYEVGRFTKRNSPLTGREYINRYSPAESDELLEIYDYFRIPREEINQCLNLQTGKWRETYSEKE